jgi:hypothetical protein
VAERKPETGTHGRFLLADKLARGGVDASDVVRVECVTYAEEIGRQPDTGAQSAGATNLILLRRDHEDEHPPADDVQQ